jgi:Histidine kinase-, DNA gyrase B-, and HSP90-like ATPase
MGVAGVGGDAEALVIRAAMRYGSNVPPRISAAQELLYDERFLARHAGSIMTDPVVALVELVANAWDAYATKVHITWPDVDKGRAFAIVDNGHGMTEDEFNARWKVWNYNRVMNQGEDSEPPPELSGAHRRPAYGRNGMGRHAAFHFHPTMYYVRTWREGTEITVEVSRYLGAGPSPFACKIIDKKKVAKKDHGTEIKASAPHPVRLTPDVALDALGTRFLADPGFEVYIDREKVNFERISDAHRKKYSLAIPGINPAIEVFIIDAGDPDRTTKQKGLAWRVGKRLVGECTWEGLDGHKLLDGRSHDAKRYTIVIFADALRESVLPDWTGFDHNSPLWKAHVDVLNEHIGSILDKLSQEKREERRRGIIDRMRAQARELTPIGREKWEEFIRLVLKQCPSFADNDLQRVAGILASLEVSQSQYGLLKNLYRMSPDELHDVNALFTEWSVATAKIVLSTIQERLSMLHELRQKMYVTTTDEVHELQPLFARSLWMFGAEFESIEFTSNVGMTKVLRSIFGSTAEGSSNRPDFVVRTDSTVGIYARPGYDDDGKDTETERIVIVELKRPGIPIGREEIDQPRKYYIELKKKGCLRKTRRVDAFVLGSELDPDWGIDGSHGDGPKIYVHPMRYDTLAEIAGKRMMRLDKSVREAPFLNPDQIDRFLDPDADNPHPELPLGQGFAARAHSTLDKTSAATDTE